MKKVYKICISLLIIILMSFYLAYSDRSVYSILSDYIQAHLNEPQQFLYIITIYSMCILWSIYVPFLEPSFYLRIPKLIEYINKRNVLYSTIFSTVTFFIYLLSAIANGYIFDFNTIYLMIILKLILYYFMCFELATSIYLLFNKMILSILSLVLINLAVISLYYTVNFYVYSNRLSDSFYKLVFYIYIIIVTITCLAFNQIYIKRKELF